jgi:hypothetical protein
VAPSLRDTVGGSGAVGDPAGWKTKPVSGQVWSEAVLSPDSESRRIDCRQTGVAVSMMER